MVIGHTESDIDAEMKRNDRADASIHNLDSYQELANGFINEARYNNDRMLYLLNTALGLCGEAGEFADIIKKVVFHGHEMTPAVREKLIEELGDVQWYIAQGCKALMVTLSDVATGNIDKLTNRHGGAKFSEDASRKKEAAKDEVRSDEQKALDRANEKGLRLGRNEEFILQKEYLKAYRLKPDGWRQVGSDEKAIDGDQWWDSGKQAYVPFNGFDLQRPVSSFLIVIRKFKD